MQINRGMLRVRQVKASYKQHFGFQHTEIHQRTNVVLDIVQHLLPSVEFDEEDKDVERLDGFDAWYH